MATAHFGEYRLIPLVQNFRRVARLASGGQSPLPLTDHEAERSHFVPLMLWLPPRQ
jgi:hypothetical protein